MSRGRLRVGVVGAGTLGTTVVRAALAAGSPVTVLVRGGPARCRQRGEELAAAVHRAAARRNVPGRGADELLAQLRITGRMADLADAEVVVESVPESASLKRQVLADLEDVVAPTTVIASTTSSIPAAVLAAEARHPERVVVAHFVWPAHRIPLVEVAFHDATSTATIGRLGHFLVALGKRTVRVADRPGFLITRALFAYWDAAVELVIDGCPPAAVDDALTGFGLPLGPFAVMEGTTLSSVARIQTDLRPHLDVPLPSLTALSSAVAAGADRIYAGNGSLDGSLGALLCRGSGAAHLGPGQIVERTVGALGNEVDRAVTQGVVASWEEAGAAIDAAYGFPTNRGGLARWWRERRPQAATVPTQRMAAPDLGAVADSRKGARL